MIPYYPDLSFIPNTNLTRWVAGGLQRSKVTPAAVADATVKHPGQWDWLRWVCLRLAADLRCTNGIGAITHAGQVFASTDPGDEELQFGPSRLHT